MSIGIGALVALRAVPYLQVELGHVGPAFGERSRLLRFARSAWQATAVEQAVQATLVADKEAVVRRPPSDPRTYRVLQLENGLQVLLASDPTASTAAAALTARGRDACPMRHFPGVVTLQRWDPLERLGLAHFHEHMLFLGTEKYPKEDEYSLAAENPLILQTPPPVAPGLLVDLAQVGSPFLEGALDRFAEFFISPTFDPSGIEREMKAVDSESTNYSTEDGWRLLQVLKATAAEEHPFFRFDVGNLDTLGAEDLPGTREQLVAGGPQSTQLEDWNKNHYQAGAMKLAVVGQQPLEELEKMALSRFSRVRVGKGQAGCKKLAKRPSSLPGASPAFRRSRAIPLCRGQRIKWAGCSVELHRPAWVAWVPVTGSRADRPHAGRIVKSVPLKEARSISAYWPLPPVQKHLFAKPELYIAHMLGHEGKGSLHVRMFSISLRPSTPALLQGFSWVDQLSAGTAQSFTDEQLFAVNITLTPEGDLHREEVLALLFESVGHSGLWLHHGEPW
ncbi:unnamed protein product [Cladocopium goreaui]|uniref:Insulin-degrading enzyme-like 1, peroxisomal (Insulysin-like 1) (Peroxisomal M16 protease) (Zinc-metallopeptidase) n=1 Tax=Cladocopium goreaui TaxID=2562237 RepID=A0A9P1D604_9DINO|nr:unnamed protein product [Cladocopium goreaui]